MSARKRWRRAARIVARILLGLGLLVVVALGAALIVLHTAWGRDRLRAEIVAALDETFVGGVEIGALEGSVLGEMILHDVVIRDRAGRKAIAIDRVRLEVALTPLLRHRVELATVIAEGVAVDAYRRDGQINLTELIRKDGEPGKWGIDVRDFLVRDATVVVDIDGRLGHFDAVTMKGAVSMPPAGAMGIELDVEATWRERSASLRVHGELRTVASAVEVPVVEISLGDARIVAHEVTLSGTTQVAGQFGIHIPAGEIGRFVTGARAGPAILLQLAAVPAVADSTVLTLDGTVAGAPVTGALNVSTSGERVRIAGTMSALQLDAARLAGAAISTAFDTELEIAVGVDPSLDGLAMIDGRIAMKGRGRIGGAILDDLVANVTIVKGIATVDALVRAPGGLQARLEAQGSLQVGGEIALSRAHLIASTSDLREATQDRIGVGGSVEADLTASGVIRDGVPDLAVAGHVIGTGLHAGAVEIGRVRLEVDLAGTPERPSGSLDATIAGAVFDGTRLPWAKIGVRSRHDGAYAISVRSRSVPGVLAPAPWSIVADAVARLDRNAASFALGRYAIRVRGIALRGSGGEIDVDDTRVRVQRIRTRVAGGTLDVDGDYRFSGPRAGDLAGHITARAVDLAAIDRTSALEGPLSGRATMQVDVRRRDAAVQASIAGSITNLVARAGGDPIDLEFESSLSPSRIALDVNARGDRIGSMNVSVDLAPPRRLTDPAAWSRIDRTAIHGVTIRADGLQLGALANALGIEPLAQGRIDGGLIITPTEVRGSLRGRALVTSLIPAPVDIELSLGAADAGMVRATSRVDLHGVGGGTIAATLRVPSRPVDPTAWALHSVRDLQVKLDDITVDDELALRLGVPGDWRGRASVMIDAASGLDGATATIVARDVIGGPMVRPVNGTVTITVDHSGVRASGDAWFAGKQIAVGEVDVAIAPAAILRTGLRALQTAPITGALHVPVTELATILTVVGGRVGRLGRTARGTVRADATLGGTLDAPVLAAVVSVADAGVRRRILLRELRLDARYQARVLTAAIRGRQDASGRLAIDTRADLAHPGSTVSSVSATGFDIRRIARVVDPSLIGVSGTLDADLTIRGLDPTTGDIEGTIKIRDAEMPLTDELGALHDATIDVELRGARARLGIEGAIESGRVTVHADATLQGLVPRTAVVDVIVKDVSLITSVAPKVNGKLHADITRQGDTWKVDAEIANGQVFIPASPGRELHETGIPSNMVFVDGVIPPVGDQPLTSTGFQRQPSGPRIDMSLRILPTEVTSEPFRGRVSGALELALGRGRIGATGRIEVVRGDVILLERRYRVDRAAVRFDGGIDPLLDIRLAHDFPQLTLRIAVTGRLSDPQLALSSDTGSYSEAQLLGFVLGGRPGDESGPVTDDAAKGVATAAVTQALGRYLGGFLPVRIDILRYEAATSAHSGALTIGRRLSDRLFVSWRSRVDARDDENTGEGSLEYWLSKRVLLDGVVGNRGIHGLDLLWTRRW